MPFNLNDLVPNEGSNRKRKRVGRGTGSGHGKTSGRGTKGQKSRSGPGVRWGFEGGQLPIQKRMPYKRGFTNIYKVQWEVVNLGTIAQFELEGAITPQLLYEVGLVRGLEFPVKILATGEFEGALDVSAHGFSAAARAAIEARGGSVTVLERDDRWVEARPRSRRLPINGELKRLGFGKSGGIQNRDDFAGDE